MSGGDGQFVFTGLPPAVYKITAFGQGMSIFTSPQSRCGRTRFSLFPKIVLAVSSVSTSVTVSGNKEELAEEQVQIAIQQRVVGIFPNFYSSYDWNAPPMEARQKLQLGIRSVFRSRVVSGSGGNRGAEQYENVFPAYGSGIEGYGKRYGAALATHVSADLLSRAVYPAIFHQDPRYFYKGNGSIRSRVLYAISAAVMARDDDGQWRPNYSNVLGNFSAGAISNLYYPASDRGASLVFLNGLADTGGDAAANLVREFILKRFTSHAPQRNKWSAIADHDGLAIDMSSAGHFAESMDKPDDASKTLSMTKSSYSAAWHRTQCTESNHKCLKRCDIDALTFCHAPTACGR